MTGREVALVSLSHEHVGALAAAAAESREHYRYNPVPDGESGARSYVHRALDMHASGQRIPFAIVWKGRVVGSTSYYDFQPWAWPAQSSLQRIDRPDALEIGFTWLAASAQRTRCNTEAKYLLLRHAFDVWQVHRVSFRTDERNERSRSAIARLGARFEGIRRADMPGVDGTIRNSAFFSILSAEWPEIRAALEGRLARPGSAP